MTRERLYLAIVIAAGLVWFSMLFVRVPNIGFVSGLVVYLCAWWMVLFTVLPRRIRGQFEDGEVVPGSEPGAPVDPGIKPKLWLTTVITSGVWLVIVAVIGLELIDLEWFSYGPQIRTG
ncbi:DUF1467 family protein [Alkalicaulis satelles]|uniref:DUF1467 family protein n=1 Tax=Alkalicaulis satelles TaxID=2609175 RepID=A0A5M6ZNL4_9PROT|nr:DUF1467 family protein [Alkalicaulis satelles]KAA5805174.1 DUF1467 family protein [Alkalicaulis satelles]